MDDEGRIVDGEEVVEPPEQAAGDVPEPVTTDQPVAEDPAEDSPDPEVVSDDAAAPEQGTGDASEPVAEANEEQAEAEATGCGCTAANGDGQRGCETCPQSEGVASEVAEVGDPDEPPVPRYPSIAERSRGTGPQLELGVAFPHNAKAYSFASGGLRAQIGDKVLVRTDKGVDLGDVVKIKGRLTPEAAEELTAVVRIATAEDLAHVAEQEERERRALQVCDEKITEHDLPMKLIDAHLSFDNTRLVFLFAAEGRVDFRELVRDLAKTFRMRIELRQVGVRDEAKLLGGIGPCGRQLCCKMFMRNFEPVGIRIAKDQGLALNPSKLSGLCDRLMCCLRFEHETYVTNKKKLPRKGTRVQVGDAVGEVRTVHVLQEELTVRLREGRDVTVSNDEVRVLRDGEMPAPVATAEQAGPDQEAAIPVSPPLPRLRDRADRSGRRERPEPAARRDPPQVPEKSEGNEPSETEDGSEKKAGRPRRRRRKPRSRRKKDAAARGDAGASADSGSKPAEKAKPDSKPGGGQPEKTGDKPSGRPRRSRGRRGRRRSRKPAGEQTGGGQTGSKPESQN